jgi:phosphatidylserine/phosphatidylglycerophosphate/cardiolipin synthase-like enzyme
MVNNIPRDLSGPGQASSIRDLLQGIFIAELIKPSSLFWITSGWISDVDFLDNSSRSFSYLNPDWPLGTIRLSSIIESLVTRGGQIRIMVREVEHNIIFLERMKNIQRRYGECIDWRTDPVFHAKGILGDDFLIEGSMNITKSGLVINDERVTFRLDPEGIAQRRLELEEKWASLAK